METLRISPENFEEKVIWYSMTGTWLFYFLGALYIVAPVIAWILFVVGLRKLVLHLIAGNSLTEFGLSTSVLTWFVGMFVMLVSLIIGHLDFNLGIASVVKSSIGWAKGWALLALFPFIGCLAIRPELIFRAACIVCLHTLMLIPIFLLVWAIGMPQVAYVSPLQAIGGPGPEFFMVSLYEIDPGSGLPRWRFFTPWAPAAGFVANVYFIFALQEKNIRWKIIGMTGCVLIILMSQSRLAMVVLLTVPLITWFVSRLSKPVMLYAVGIGSALLGLLALPLIGAAETAWTTFKEARADSSRVRAALGRIAVDRWQSEAPIWGHGVVERGPHLVEYMPIGSHHSWYGLLFVKGIVGLFALAIPMIVSVIELFIKAQSSALARVGLSIMLILFLYTFGENLEVLAYLFWPGLLFLGLGVKSNRLGKITCLHISD